MTENSLQLSNWRGRFFRYAPLILWIGIILFASGGQASMAKTSRFLGPLLEFLFPTASPETIYTYNHYIRKFAHLSVYFVLAFWAFRAFSKSSVSLFKQNWFVVSLGLVALVASTDEFHQSFNPSRGGSVYDVLLDIFGALLFLLIPLTYPKFKNRKT